MEDRGWRMEDGGWRMEDGMTVKIVWRSLNTPLKRRGRFLKIKKVGINR